MSTNYRMLLIILINIMEDIGTQYTLNINMAETTVI